MLRHVEALLAAPVRDPANADVEVASAPVVELMSRTVTAVIVNAELSRVRRSVA
jgi:hypothetical protein